MKKSNLFLVGLGYAAGLLVALKFSKDGKNKDLADLAEDVKTVHRNLWTEGEAKVFSEENRERVAKLKAKALREISTFRRDAEKRIAEMKEKGDVKKEELEAALTEMYDESRERIQELVDDGIAFAKDLAEDSGDMGGKLRKKLESVGKDLASEFETAYKDLKKKLK